jgi:DNA repair protein RecO (recombination protein O)
VPARTYTTQAIVLRSMRFSEADRILHLYTESRGRIGAIAKGVRKTRSRFGARLEPLSHVELLLHEGAGELQTITGVELLRSHHAVREHPYRLDAGLIGAEAMLRLFGEPEANARAFGALARFLDLLEELPAAAGRAAVDPLVLAFQLKLLWLAGYLPHLTSCVECGETSALAAFSPRAGGAVCGDHAQGEAIRLSPDGLAGTERLLSTPLADADAAGLSDRARRDALAVITSSYEEHGGFRLRTLRA